MFQLELLNKRCLPGSKTAQKKGSGRYLIFGPNRILVTLRWDDGCSPGHENVCQWFLNRYK